MRAMESQESDIDNKTEFAKRNPVLAKVVPNRLENAVDLLLPNSIEAVLDKAASKTSIKYHELRTNIEEGLGEVAGVLFQVAKYAFEKFHIGDLVFGVYQLYLHHSTVNSTDAVDGTSVTDLALVDFLIQAATAAAAAYCPTRESLCAAAGISDEDLLLFVPETTPTRPAYAVWQDKEHHRLIWGFRGTTDLNDMLTDACAACSPYCGGAAHWGMLSAAQWFVENEVAQVKELLHQRPGYELLLVGHSLGAGTAAMLAHMLKNDSTAADILGDVRFKAVGIATPAVLTEELAGSCREYITSVVLMHDIVPRFSIHNVFKMKEEMDATDWEGILKLTVQDWMVPDIIENTATYQRLARKADTKAQELKHHTHRGMAHISALGGSAAASVARFFKGRHDKHSEGNGDVNNTAQQGGNSNGAGVGVGAGATAAAAAAAMTSNGRLEAAAKAALKNPRVVEQAVDDVTDNLKDVNMNDVHEVFAPGRLFFIKRLDKFKGRARYGDAFHRCALCQDDSTIPQLNHEGFDPEEHTSNSQPTTTTTTTAAATAAADAAVMAGTASRSWATAACAAHTAATATAAAVTEPAEGEGAATAAAAAAVVEEAYPGAAFELLEAIPKQRFRKIVLRDTCLQDHLCSGYMQGLTYAFKQLSSHQHRGQ